MSHVKVLNITEDDNGLHVEYQCQCGQNPKDVMNRKVGPFNGDDPWEDVRLWLSMNAEAESRKRQPRGVPDDIADLVGRDADTSELQQRFKPSRDAFNARAAAERQQGEQT